MSSSLSREGYRENLFQTLLMHQSSYIIQSGIEPADGVKVGTVKI